MKAEVPTRGERLTPALADALVAGFPGIAVLAEQARKDLRGATGLADDPDGAVVTAATLGTALQDTARWPGIRDAVAAAHPIAVNLRAALAATPDAIPEPNSDIVDLLEKEPGFAISVRVVTIDDVPVPAGAEQTAYFVILRYRPMFSPFADPARLYRGDLAYDAVNVTDELQESVLLVSTAIYRDHLLLLQRNASALYLAIWFRHTDMLDDLVAAMPAELLPPPYGRSQFSDRRKCLLIATDIMMEWERVFELQHALRSIGGVTRDSVKAALLGASSISGIRAIPTATGRHIAGAVAHARVIHPTMNKRAATDQSDAVFGAVAAGFDNSRVYGRQYRRVRWVAGKMPTRFFPGIEPTMLVPVALIQMQDTLVRREHKF